MPVNPEKQRIALLVRQLLKRSRFSVVAVIARIAEHGVDLSEDQFENRFTLRMDRRPHITPAELLALIKALTQKLSASRRCHADEAIELALLAGLPTLLPQIEPLFPPTEYTAAFQRRFALGLNLALDAPITVPPLPRPLTAVIGRDAEVTTIIDLLSEHQLLTLTGPGGCGKTRLALQVAAMSVGVFRDGVAFISLADLADPELVLATITHALSLPAIPDRPWLQLLATSLAQRHMLLILDNFEHVLSAASALHTLLTTCPHLHALVTSRVTLRLSGERPVVVPPLGLPPPGPLPPPHELAHYPAIALFCERAQATRPDFSLHAGNAADLAALCVALDGLPLGIELAAARINQLASAQLRAYLVSDSGRLDLALLSNGTRDLPPRQHTLRATLDWSYHLLDPEAQVLFASMAVFSGGCTVEALGDIVGAPVTPDVERLGLPLDALATLLDHHIITTTSSATGTRRYRMLATVREYALERLSARGAMADTQRRHADHYLRLARQAAAHLRGSDQSIWFGQLEVEQPNIRAALEWLVAQADVERALELCAALELFWYWGGSIEEGITWLRRVLALRSRLSPRALAKNLDELAGLEWARGFPHEAEHLAHESLALWRELGDPQGIAETLNTLGLAAEAVGDFTGSIAWHQESLALRRQIGDLSMIVVTLNNLGDAEFAAGPAWYNQALAHFQESLTINRQLGNQRGIGDTLNSMGRVMLLQGDYAQASHCLCDSLRAFQQLGNKLRIVYALEHLADIALAHGQAARAARLCATAAALRAALRVQPLPVDIPTIASRNDAIERLLDHAVFTAEWATGMALTLDQAITYALEVAER